MELKFRRRCVTHTDKYNHWFFFFLLWYNFIMAYVLSRCCDITSGKADTFSWLYNVNVLTQRMFPSGQTLKVGKFILLKSLLDDILFIPKDEAWPLFFFFCLFEIIEKIIESYGYSSMWNREIDLVHIYFSWEDCEEAILSLLLKANSKKCPTRWNEQAIALLLQCTVCWIKKGLLIWHLGKFAGE